MKLTSAQSEFVERVGRWWEDVGGSRTAGRILGGLMICEPAHQSSQDLVDSLQASAGSVSTQARQLETIGLVERVTFPGDRSTYYRLPPKVWEQVLWSELDRMRAMHDLALAAESVIPDESPDRVRGLRRISEFLIAEWPNLMGRLSEHLEKEEEKPR